MEYLKWCDGFIVTCPTFISLEVSAAKMHTSIFTLSWKPIYLGYIFEKPEKKKGNFLPCKPINLTTECRQYNSVARKKKQKKSHPWDTIHSFLCREISVISSFESSLCLHYLSVHGCCCCCCRFTGVNSSHFSSSSSRISSPSNGIPIQDLHMRWAMM